MGCYNVSCSISHISIGWFDEIVYIPLVLNQYAEYKVGDGNNQLIGCGCFYSPATLPLFGQYDDYGSINIVDDENVLFLQEKFQCNINQFISLRHDKFETPSALKPICSGMFVHREIYDMMVSDQLDDFGKKSPEQTRKYWETQFDQYQQDLNETRKKALDYGLEPEIFNIRLSMMSSPFQFTRHAFLNEIYHPCMFEGKFKQQFIDLLMFEIAMYSLNCFYFPAMNGCQSGNPYMSKLLYKKSLEIVNKEIKERKKK